MAELKVEIELPLPYLDADLSELEREVAVGEAGSRPSQRSCEAFDRVLAEVPDVEPDRWDRWTLDEAAGNKD